MGTCFGGCRRPLEATNIINATVPIQPIKANRCPAIKSDECILYAFYTPLLLASPLLSTLPSIQIPMQNILSHPQTQRRCSPRHPENNPPNASQCFQRGLQRPFAQWTRHLPQHIQIISNPRNPLRRTVIISNPFPQPRAQQIRKGRAGHADADGAPGAAERVARAGDDGLVLVRDGRDEREQRDGEEAAVRDPREREGGERLPRRALAVQDHEVQRRGEHVRGHERHVEAVVPARGAHDEAGAEGADGRAERAGDEARARGPRGVALDLEVDGRVVQVAEVRHAREPVAQARGRDGPVEQQPHGDDRLGGAPLLHVHEHPHCHSTQRQRHPDQRVAPGDDVSAGIQAQEQEHERRDQRRGARKIHAPDLRRVGLFDGDIDDEEHDAGAEQDQRHLHEERGAPGHRVGHPAAEHAPNTAPHAKKYIPEPLVHPALPQRHQIRRHERRDRVHTPASDPRDHAAQDDHPLRLREAADERPRREDGVRPQQPVPPAEDVGQLPRERLQRGVGDEVRGREPGEEREGGEGRGDGPGDGREHRRVERREEDADPGRAEDQGEARGAGLVGDGRARGIRICDAAGFGVRGISWAPGFEERRAFVGGGRAAIWSGHDGEDEEEDEDEPGRTGTSLPEVRMS